MADNKTKLFSIRNFSFLWVGQTISVLGSQFSGLAFAVLAVTILGANEIEMGVLNASGTAAFLLVGLVAGAWVDRWLKRRVMLIADVVRLVATASIPVLFLMDALQMWHVFVVTAIIGLATVFFDVAYQSYVPLLVPKDKIGPANSMLETSAQVAHLGGPTVVGLLLAVVKAPVVILIDAISFGVSALSLMFIRDTEVPAPKSERRPLRAEIAEGIRFVWGQRIIRSISFTTATSNLFSTAFYTLLPLLVLRDLGLSPAEFGLIQSIGAIGGLVGAMSTTRLVAWLGEGFVIAGSAVISGLSMVAAPLVAMADRELAVWILLPNMFLMSFTVLTYNITQVSARQRLCPEKLLGRMNASIRFFVWGVMPISAILTGFIASAIGIVATLWISFAGALLASTFVVFSPLSRMRQINPDEAAAL